MQVLYVISGLGRDTEEIRTVPGFHVTNNSNDNYMSTFRDNLMGPIFKSNLVFVGLARP